MISACRLPKKKYDCTTALLKGGLAADPFGRETFSESKYEPQEPALQW